MQQPALGTPSLSGFVSSSEGVPMGPCESCGRQLPLTDLIKHEVSNSHVASFPGSLHCLGIRLAQL